MARSDTPIIQLKNIGKNYGAINALRGVNLTVRQGEVTCILGDNGAGKSTLISIIAGLFPHDAGEYLVDGKLRQFSSPREALDLGIAAVYQTLALVPLLPVWRNFFLGSELVTGKGPLRRLDIATMLAQTSDELHRMGNQSRKPRTAGGHALGRPAPGGGDRPRRPLRRPRLDPR